MIYVKMRSRRKIMEQESETESQVQSQFPSQEERVHARAALAMFGKLDIEEQETASDDSQAETQQGWNQDFYGKLLTCARSLRHHAHLADCGRSAHHYLSSKNLVRVLSYGQHDTADM